MSLPKNLLRRVTQDEVDTFWRDGVVCIRNIIPIEWIEAISGPVDAALGKLALDLSEHSDKSAAQNDGQQRARRGRFLAIADLWRQDPVFRWFCTETAVPEIAGHIMRSRKVNLFNDAVFVKEPGALEKSAFHQDLSYFCADGNQMCTMWIALDEVVRETGAVQFIKGSHLWKQDFRQNIFTSDKPAEGVEDGEVVPDYSSDPRGETILSFDLSPGDLTIHHTRTIHGAGSNTSQTRRRRGVSLRYCGDDAVYKIKRGGLVMPHRDEVADGMSLDHKDCPVVWRDNS